MKTPKKLFCIILTFLVAILTIMDCGEKKIIDDTPGSVAGHVYVKDTSPPEPIDSA